LRVRDGRLELEAEEWLLTDDQVKATLAALEDELVGLVLGWPPRPPALAAWPVRWRQEWADRTADLEAGGLDWRAAERQAFDETRAARHAAGLP
jgi:hypothetical protein